MGRVTLRKSLASADLSSLRLLAAGGDLIAYTPFMSRPEIDKFARARFRLACCFVIRCELLISSLNPTKFLEDDVPICKMYFQAFRLCIALYLASALVRCQNLTFEMVVSFRLLMHDRSSLACPLYVLQISAELFR